MHTLRYPYGTQTAFNLGAIGTSPDVSAGIVTRQYLILTNPLLITTHLKDTEAIHGHNENRSLFFNVDYLIQIAT